MKIYKLNNMELNSNGITRGKRCNILGTFCVFCQDFHEIERKEWSFIDLEDGSDMKFVCNKSLELELEKSNES